MNFQISETLNLNDVITLIALFLSLFSVIIQFINIMRQRFNLKIIFNNTLNRIIDPLDTTLGNNNSMVLSVRIINNSDKPIMISNIKLSHKNLNFSVFAFPCNIDANIEVQNGDFVEFWKIGKEQIILPLYLSAYEETTKCIVFPHSFSASIDAEYEKFKLKFITSRGNKLVTAQASTPAFRKTWFN